MVNQQPEQGASSTTPTENGTNNPSANNNEQPTQAPTQTGNEQPFLYGGKYKTPDDILHALKAQQTENFNLQKQYEVPEQYQIAENYNALGSDVVNEMQQNAKNNNMTQKQFDNMMNQLVSYNDQQKNTVQAKKQQVLTTLGENAQSKIADVEQYIERTYPASMQQQLKNEINTNVEAFNHMQMQFNNSVAPSMPGMSAPSPAPKGITKKDVHNAFLESEKYPNDIEKIKHFRELNNRYIEQEHAKLST